MHYVCTVKALNGHSFKQTKSNINYMYIHVQTLYKFTYCILLEGMQTLDFFYLFLNYSHKRTLHMVYSDVDSSFPGER